MSLLPLPMPLSRGCFLLRQLSLLHWLPSAAVSASASASASVSCTLSLLLPLSLLCLSMFNLLLQGDHSTCNCSVDIACTRGGSCGVADPEVRSTITQNLSSPYISMSSLWSHWVEDPGYKTGQVPLDVFLPQILPIAHPVSCAAGASIGLDLNNLLVQNSFKM